MKKTRHNFLQWFLPLVVFMVTASASAQTIDDTGTIDPVIDGTNDDVVIYTSVDPQSSTDAALCFGGSSTSKSGYDVFNTLCRFLGSGTAIDVRDGGSYVKDNDVFPTTTVHVWTVIHFASNTYDTHVQLEGETGTTAIRTGASWRTSSDYTVSSIDTWFMALSGGSSAAVVNSIIEVANVGDFPAVSFDATLSDLSSDVGTLSPAFSSDTYSYLLQVPEMTSSVSLTATKNDAAASVSGGGTINLSADETIADIVVTAESGDMLTYSVHIYYEGDYLFNESFDNDPNALTSGNYKTDDAEPRLKPVAGWTAEYAGNSAGGVFEYGSTAQLNDYTVTATDAEGATPTSGSGLVGTQSSWGNSAVYYQDLTLPAGSYEISYNAYNAHTTNTSTESLVGWVPDAGSSALSSLTSFAAGDWTSDVITFALVSETSGRIQIGVQDIAGGSGSNPRLFFDDLQIVQLAQSADATLSALSVDAGTLLPAFDPEVTDYIVYAPSGTTSVNVSATANDGSAQSVTGTGSIDVTSGNGSTTVTVTAEAGNTIDYNVRIYVNDATNLIDWWDGNGITGAESSPDVFGWENTAGDAPWNDYNGSGGCRLRDLSGYTYEDGGATVTGVQLLLRYDGSVASETSAFTYPVVLEANTVYEFTFDYVYGDNASSPPVTLTAGIGTSNDVTSDVASKDFETTSTLYRIGSLVFVTDEAGVYYVKFTCNEKSWDGISNLSLTTSDAIVWNGVWSNGTGPTAADNAVIQTPLDVTGDMAVNDLDVTSNGSLSVASGASLAIMGTASGDATIMRNTTGDMGYSIVGAPVSGADLSVLAADYLYTYDEATTSWTIPSGTMAPGVGYFAGYDAATPEVMLTGAMVSGNVNTAITNSGDGYSIVANPYAAAISVDAFIANSSNSTTTTGAVYLWNDGGDNLGGDRAGDYVVYNEMTSGMNVGSVQGFFVQAQAAGDVQFTPDMQVTTADANDDANYYRKANSDEKQLLKLSISGNNLYNETLIGFVSRGTFGRDYALDAEKLSGNEFISFYSMIKDEKMAIQGLPLVETDPIEVELGMDLKEAGDYKVSVEHFAGFSDDVTVTLIDVQTGATYELGEHVEIPFATTEAMVDAKRFKVVVAPAKTLSTTDIGSKLQVFGGKSELTINYVSNKAEMINIFSLDGKIVFNKEVAFDNNQAVIRPAINRNQIYVLRVNEETIKFILK